MKIRTNRNPVAQETFRALGVEDPYICEIEDLAEHIKAGDCDAGEGVYSRVYPLGQNEVFASVSGMSTPNTGMPTSCSKPNIQNPQELLPKDSNNQWAQLNPSGKGELANINLLKAGYHIGIDTIGESLRNANLQIRSEPPNPQTYVGPWNQSTITPDFLRPPLEIGNTAVNLQ